MPEPNTIPQKSWSDLEPLLDQELNRLPERYRAALILCDLEGKTRKAAALQLGLPEGTISSRLARARGMLATRLTRRGVVLSAGTLAVLCSQHAASAAVPSALVASTVKVAAIFATTHAAPAGLISAKAAALTKAGLKSMLLTKLALASTLLVASVGTIAILPALSGGAPEGKVEEAATAEIPAPADDDPRFAVVAGVVVDESDKPVSGVAVQSLNYAGATPAVASDREGRFRIQLNTPLSANETLIAALADDPRQGLVETAANGLRYDRVRSVRIVLKPPREVIVEVRDGRGTAIADTQVVAAHENAGVAFFHGRTRPDGRIHLQLPADAKIGSVFAWKQGTGFDYWTAQVSDNSSERLELPTSTTLTLNGAFTARVRAVNSSGNPVPGIPIVPFFLRTEGKADTLNIAGCHFLEASTDAKGIAVFDWLPVGSGRIPFDQNSLEYCAPNQTQLNNPAAAANELTMQLMRCTKVSGRIIGADGQPAPGIALQAEGRGPTNHYCRKYARTGANGSYEFLLDPEENYIIEVVDENWAAPSQVGIAMHEDQPIDGLDFQLGKGTLIRGTLTSADRRPLANTNVTLIHEAVPVAQSGQTEDKADPTTQLVRWAHTDAKGRYQIRVGPGTYKLSGPSSRPTPLTIQAQTEVIQDLQQVAQTDPPALGVAKPRGTFHRIVAANVVAALVIVAFLVYRRYAK